MPKTQRTVQYRYLDRKFAELGDKTLYSALIEALEQKRDGHIIGQEARARIADLEQSGQLTLWNGILSYPDKAILAGELLLYKKGFNVTAVEERIDKTDNRFQLVTFQTDGVSKPVDGALYFAVIGDQLGVIQSNVVTSRWLERYFTWLLKDITGKLAGDQIINLNARVEIDDKSLDRLGGAQALTIHASSAPHGNDGAPNATGGVDLPASRQFRSKAKSRGTATVLEILQLLGIGEDTIESIQSDVPKGGSLEGDFLVYIKEGRSKRPFSLGSLDRALRHTQPGDIDIMGKDGKIRDNLQTLSKPVRVDENAIGLDPNDAIAKIIETLYHWAEQGIVNLGPSG